MHSNMVVRQAVGDSRTPLVFLHGLGADEHDLMGLASAFSPQHPIYSVRAPSRYGDGYQWFEIDWESESRVADPGEIEAAGRYVIDQLPNEPVVCLGFSQGGIIAQEILRAFPNRVSGLILLSTWPLPGLEPRQADVPILLQHGNLDPVVPVRAVDLLAETWLGDEVSLMKYPMAHQISAASLNDLSHWFAKRFGDSSAARSVS